MTHDPEYQPGGGALGCAGLTVTILVSIAMLAVLVWVIL